MATLWEKLGRRTPLGIGLQRGMENRASNAYTHNAKIGQVAENGILVLPIRSNTTDCIENYCCYLAEGLLMLHMTLKEFVE